MKKTAETAIKREWASTRVLFLRLLNAVLNRIFALDVSGSEFRRRVLTTMFLLTGVLITFIVHPLKEWTPVLQNVFTALFVRPAALVGAVTGLGKFLLGVIFDPTILRFLPVFVLPYILSQEAASRFLADIFEFDEIGIARSFISEVAFRGGNNELHLSVTKIDEEEIETSPLSRIGGPGYVSIELDTAILVEKPDGRPRVIGPTSGGKVVLDGFERIRDMIDLRDQIPDSLEASARSKDGIPISVADVRVVFSVYRDRKTPTPAEPHPFQPDAVRAMVYSKTHRVTDAPRIHETWYKSSGDPIWVIPMKSLITGSLSSFMSTRNLGEYLASIGEPETKTLDSIEKKIAEEKQKTSGESLPSQPSSNKTPEFTPRSKISGQFYSFGEFAKKFNDEQRKRGVQIEWVGVGTWKMPLGIPSKVIPDKYLEAWRLTNENKTRSSDQYLNNQEKEAYLLELQRIIQMGPILTHHNNIDNNIKNDMAQRALMMVYNQQFNDVLEKTRKKKERVPPSIVAAYYYVFELIFHSPPPNVPAPQSKEEANLYTEALTRISSTNALERMIILEAELNPNAGRVDHLRTIIRAWDDDMK